MRPKSVLLLSSLVVASICNGGGEKHPADYHQGVWRQVGYGRVLQISDSHQQVYDVTDRSCLRVYEKNAGPRDGLIFARDYETLDRIRIVDARRFEAMEAGGITRYAFERLAALPEACRGGAVRSNDPELNFEIFWRSFAENYAFFELHRVDWDQVYREFRPKVSIATSDETLFALFSEMIRRLDDGHVSLTAQRPDGKEWHFRSGAEPVLLEMWAKKRGLDPAAYATWLAFLPEERRIIMDLLGEGARTAANGQIIWGRLDQDIGYVGMRLMSVGEGSAAQKIRIVEDTMQQVLKDIGSSAGLVIDIRTNPGGEDTVGIALAEHFVTQRTLAFTKKAMDRGRLTEEQPVFLEPRGTRQYAGPKVVLVSGSTMSAAESFALALAATPKTWFVGTPTYGILSDMLPKTLANGWNFDLSNEVYRAPDGTIYEGVGLPVAVTASFEPDRFDAGYAEGIDRAVAMLRTRSSAR